MQRSEEGSTIVESVVAIVFLMTLVLGAIQVILTLYSMNVVRAAAHEGLRSAIERGASGRAAEVAARNALARAAGRLLGEVEVELSSSVTELGPIAKVRVQGNLRALGPVPLVVPLTATAHGVIARDPR